MKSKKICKECEKETVFKNSFCMGCFIDESIENKLKNLEKESNKIPKDEILITVDDINLTKKDISFHIFQSMKCEAIIECIKIEIEEMRKILNCEKK